MRRALILILGVGFFTPAVAQAKEKMAIMPFSASRLPKETARVLDDLLTAAVYKVDLYNVMTAGDINALLGLDRMKDAVGCSDVSCAAEIGGALGVDWLLQGSAGLLGKELVITLSLIDTHQKKQALRAQRRVEEDESLYAWAIEASVAELFNRPAPPPPVRVPPNSGTLMVTSTPPGARVLAQGHDLGKTPLRAPITAATYEVTISLEGHLPHKELVTITAGAETKVTTTLMNEEVMRKEVDKGRMVRIISGSVTAALGVGALVTGAVLYFLLPSKAKVSNTEYTAWQTALANGDPSAGDLQKKFYAAVDHHNLITGVSIGLGILGVGLIATAIPLFATMPKMMTSSVTVGLAPGSASVGWVSSW